MYYQINGTAQGGNKGGMGWAFVTDGTDALSSLAGSYGGGSGAGRGYGVGGTNGANGAIRVIWGSGKTYPHNSSV